MKRPKPPYGPVTIKTLTKACVVIRNLMGFKKKCLKDSLRTIGGRPEDSPFTDLTDYELNLTRDISLLQTVRVMLYDDLRMMYLAEGSKKRRK